MNAPTSEDITDLIGTCELVPCEDVTGRLLEICSALNQRVDTLKAELLQEKKWRASIQRGEGGEV